MKIGIVDCGMVGSTSGFALVMNGVGREIIFVDSNRARAGAEANDILNAVPFAHPSAEDAPRSRRIGRLVTAVDKWQNQSDLAIFRDSIRRWCSGAYSTTSPLRRK